MNKNILITGASGNLGSNVTKTLQDAGAHIYATVSSERSAERLKPMGISTTIVDLSSETDVKAYVQEVGQDIDAAVLLVGGFALGGFQETDAASLRKMYTLNFETAYFLVRELMPFFEARGRGQFILVGSRPALKPTDGKKMIAYALSKGLIMQLAEIINAHGKKQNIDATVIVPSTLDTPRNRENIPNADFSHWVSLDAVADTVKFILSDAGAQVRDSVIKLYNQT